MDPDIFVDGLREASEAGRLPSTPVTAQGLLDARTVLQVAVSFPPITGTPEVGVTGVGGLARAEVPRRGCMAHSVGAGDYLDLHRTSQGGQIALRSPTGSVAVQLIDRDGRGATPRRLLFPAGTRLHIGTTTSHATLRLLVDGPTLDLCAPADGR